MQAKSILPEFKDSQEAFEQAIAKGRLSRIRSSANYVGSYMYMGTWNGFDQFKNINTREYLPTSGVSR